MTKPADIPQSVWDDAKITFDALEYAGAAYRGEKLSELDRAEAHDRSAISYAILAEREACAKIVELCAEVISDEIAREESNMMRQALSSQRNALLMASASIRLPNRSATPGMIAKAAEKRRETR